MTVSPPAPVTAAAERAADGAADVLVPWILAHPWAPWVVGTIAVIQLAQPLLRALASRTRTPVDDAIVRALGWLVGAWSRHAPPDRRR